LNGDIFLFSHSRLTLE